MFMIWTVDNQNYFIRKELNGEFFTLTYNNLRVSLMSESRRSLLENDN